MNLQEIYVGDPPYPLTYINDIGEAIIHVDQNYCLWSYQNANSIQKTERVFAYELYHQFRLLMSQNKSYENIRFDGEVGKQQHVKIDDYGLTLSNFNPQQIHFSPDLVIHKGQDYNDIKNQMVIVEIKTKRVNRNELLKTFLKLIHYIRAFNFQYAVFLTVNTEFNEIKINLIEHLDELVNSQYAEKFNRIIVMNYVHGKLTVDTLEDIIRNNDNHQTFSYTTL
jgi:hypothetical protein